MLSVSSSATGAKQLREEVVATLSHISETMTQTISGLASAQKAQLEHLPTKLGLLLRQASVEKLDGVRVESGSGAETASEKKLS